MSTNHTCSDSCFVSRNSDKMIIICFSCGSKCNLKCHKINTAQVINSVRADSHVVFLCSMCLISVPKPKNRKSSSGRKSSHTTTVGTAPSRDEGHSPLSQNTHISHDSG